MRMNRLLQAAMFALMFGPLTAAAQDFDVGLAAYEAGDHASALREWTPLAEQGDAWAQHSLGVMYAKGPGMPQDYAEAAKWFRLAAAQGDAGAQTNLGVMYANGQGVPQDHAVAVKWSRLAAEQGEVYAHYNLGVGYERGQGVPQDFITAHVWFNLAAAKGYEAATERRDSIAARMTPADISEAQRRASACMASNYRDCD